MKILLVLALAALGSPIVAQFSEPVDFVDQAARERGDRSQVLVLGSAHLTALPDDFDRTRFENLVARLTAWAPEKIAIENLSGPQCDYLRDYAFAYPDTAETYCPDPMRAREALLVGPVEAEREALDFLKRETLAPFERRRLAALFLAIGEPDSALLQWLLLPESERHADDVLTPALIAILDKRVERGGESTIIGVEVARRLGLQRIYPVDDHTGDRASGETDDAVYEREIMQAWDNPFVEQRISRGQAQQQALVDGEISVLEWYRYLNSPEEMALAMRGDFGAAAGARDQAGLSGRRYLAYWETRNLRMAANIREITGPDSRVLAIVGASHQPYYRRYLGMTSDIELADLDAVLADGPARD